MIFYTRFLFHSFGFFATASLAILPLSFSPASAQEEKASLNAPHVSKQKPHTPKQHKPAQHQKTFSAPAKKSASPSLAHKAASRPKSSKQPHPAPHSPAASHGKGKICLPETKQITLRRRGKVLQCVGYVHLAAPDFKIHGDAHTWWKKADEKDYAKGNSPVPGAVLSFRATKRMIYGHVALVRSQEDDRTIRIDHAHWGINGIDKNVRVIDVSPKNDWTAVRVAVRGHPNAFGSVYPTNGFIYPWSKKEQEERELCEAQPSKGRPFGKRPTAHVKFKLPDASKKS